MTREGLVGGAQERHAVGLLQGRLEMRPWHKEPHLDESNTGYVREHRFRVDHGVGQKFEFEEVKDISLLNGVEVARNHSVLVSILDGAHSRNGYYDLVTSFGIGVDTQAFRVYQTIQDGLDLNSPGEIERLRRYRLFEIGAKEPQEQLRAVTGVVSTSIIPGIVIDMSAM